MRKAAITPSLTLLTLLPLLARSATACGRRGRRRGGSARTLTALTVTGPDGKPAEGTLKDGAFTPKDGLAVDTEYKARATAPSGDGKETASESSFHTLKPSKERTETVTVLPAGKTTVGVGQPLSLTFDHPVKNKAEVDITHHELTLKRDGEAVKSIPITAGNPASTPTWSGRMTVMTKEGTIRMTASTVGMTGYDQPVHQTKSTLK